MISDESLHEYHMSDFSIFGDPEMRSKINLFTCCNVVIINPIDLKLHNLIDENERTLSDFYVMSTT